jgi:hypothetical protein
MNRRTFCGSAQNLLSLIRLRCAMGEAGRSPDPADGAVKEGLDRLLPVLTAGMTPKEAGMARETLEGLFALRAAGPGPWDPGKEIAKRLKKAEGLSPEGRRRMLQEDALALEVGRIGVQVTGTALRVTRGEVQVTGEMKRETRRTLARLGQLNAVLVGRFPHLTPLLGEVSDAYLDGMFILGDGQGPTSTRLRKAKGEGEGKGPGPGA